MKPVKWAVKESPEALWGKGPASIRPDVAPRSSAYSCFLCPRYGNSSALEGKEGQKQQHLTFGNPQQSGESVRKLTEYYLDLAGRIHFPRDEGDDGGDDDGKNNAQLQSGEVKVDTEEAAAAAAAAGSSKNLNNSTHNTGSTQPGIRTADSDIANRVKLIGVITSIQDRREVTEEAMRKCWEMEIFDLRDPTYEVPNTIAPTGNRVEGRDTVALYSSQVSRFTGLFLGAVVGVIGDVFQRDLEHRPTSVMVKRFVFPAFPPTRPLLHASSFNSSSTPGQQRGAVRLHFCSGPFPRSINVFEALTSIVGNAVARKADLLVFAGPLIAPLSTRDQKPEDQRSFTDELFTLEEQIQSALGLDEQMENKSLPHHTKVAAIPSMEDMIGIPVLPQVPFASFGTAATTSGKDQIITGCNPSEILLNIFPSSDSGADASGTKEEEMNASSFLRIGVCSDDAVSLMREGLIERGFPIEGGLQRCVETILRNDLYFPLMERPSPYHDLSNLNRVRIRRTWSEIAAALGQDVKNSNITVKQEQQKGVKIEHREGSGSPAGSSTANSATTAGAAGIKNEASDPKREEKSLPHILLFPSNKRSFAYVVDNTLVINPGIHDPRLAAPNAPFIVRVAEVTVNNGESFNDLWGEEGNVHVGVMTLESPPPSSSA